MKNADSSSHYWPGFVDALTNVVFVMIIMVVVLTLMFMTTMMRVVASEKERAAFEAKQEQMQPTQATIEAPKVAQAAEKIVSMVMGTLQAPPKVPTVTVAKGPEKERPDADATRMRGYAYVAYPGDRTDFDDATAVRLKELLASNMDVIRDKGLVLTADSNPPFISSGRRQAYYRVVALREWLVAAGVPSSKIEMVISDEQLVPGKWGALLAPKGETR